MIYIHLNVILSFKLKKINRDKDIYIGVGQTSKPILEFDLKLNFLKERKEREKKQGRIKMIKGEKKLGRIKIIEGKKKLGRIMIIK